MGTTTRTTTQSDWQDQRLDPQIVDMFSQSGMNRDRFSNALERMMMNSLSGGGGRGGGGGGYGGGGGGGIGGKKYGYSFDLDRLNFSDPDIQMGLSANLRGSREGESDILRKLGMQAGRSGVSGGRALAAQEEAMRGAAQERAGIKYDTRLDFLQRQEGRDDLIGQLKSALESSRMGAQSGFDQAQAGANAQIQSARIGAAVGHESNALQRQMMPFNIASQMYNPYAVNFGSKTPGTTTETIKEKKGFWDTFTNVLGGVAGAAGSLFGAGGLSNIFRGGGGGGGGGGLGSLFGPSSGSGYGNYTGFGQGSGANLGNNFPWSR